VSTAACEAKSRGDSIKLRNLARIWRKWRALTAQRESWKLLGARSVFHPRTQRSGRSRKPKHAVTPSDEGVP